MLCRRFSFYNTHLRGKKNVAYVQICVKHPLRITYLSKFILRNSNKLCVYISNTNIFAFTTFHLRGQTYSIFLYICPWVRHISIYLYPIKHRNPFTYYILICALYTVHTFEIKQMSYQMYQADYCLKHLTLYQQQQGFASTFGLTIYT